MGTGLTMALVAVFWLAGPTTGSAEPRSRLAVVVGIESTVQDVSVDRLREMYLRRQRLWPDGSRIIPVNLPADHPTREIFSTRVLGRRPRDLVGYWNGQYFQGIRPPIVLRSPKAICAYVAVEPTAIGYVPVDTVDEDGCRVVRMLP